MNFSTQRPASKQLLLDNVSELDILLLFCKDFKAINRRFKSPIFVSEKEDEGIGTAYILHKGDRFKLYDHRIGKSFDPFSLAMIMTGMNFTTVIKYLCGEFNLVNNEFSNYETNRVLVDKIIDKQLNEYTIDVKYENWAYDSLSYWVAHGWSPYMLDRALIRPIERFWMTNNDEYRVEYNRPSIGPISFTYDFCEINGIFRRKIYNPLASNKIFKWKNNTNRSIIQALNTIDYHVGELYMVSSMKDIGPLWSINNKPCAIAPNSESTLLSPNQIRMIRQKSNKQIIWFDNDKAGRLNALRQSKLYGFECMWNPIGSPKDQSDYWKIRGGNEFKKLIL